MWGYDYRLESGGGTVVEDPGTMLQAAAWSETNSDLIVRLASTCRVVEVKGPIDLKGAMTTFEVEVYLPKTSAASASLDSSNTTIRSVINHTAVECSPIEGHNVSGTLVSASPTSNILQGSFEAHAELFCEAVGQLIRVGTLHMTNGWFQAKRWEGDPFPPSADNLWWLD